jgi:hypothetical protein
MTQSNKIQETLNSIERTRVIVQEILKYGVTEQCIARIIQGLALNSEDSEFVKNITNLTKIKIDSLQAKEKEENTLQETKKTLII